ncbi:Lipopolysaccharide-modifying protein [Penicillium digitatum]|uniref:Uncharacterized protein n=3 Tax=Penicillium digitatum TaxID=36651 RepID=K9GR41_PEND2|nr:hypothetical protein PDIP_87910 [Penicillium digitatum Pd1]EKV04283.1 hypothetical protein PDIP_87910 [Penicillium digitatum Pd1]EKV17153.1 hypothetical protein PDIG_16400 [Penicillium digitatum PHI26]QQK39806.1 Lipopolysaccharide-modifying protein [Penicillium digitatum]
MSPTGNKFLTNSHLSRSYKEASTCRWQLQALFQSFLEDRPADTILAVQERRLLISWDLRAIHYLRRCLRMWIRDKVPGDAIGAFLVTILYEQDFHLDYRLTLMVRNGQSQLHIARRLLAFYQIRDEADAPIWDNLTVYDEDAHSKQPASHCKIVAGSSATARKETPHRIPTPPPANSRWPLFMGALSDPEIEDIMNKLGDDDQYAEEDMLPLFTGVREEDLPIIQAFRRFTLHKNDFPEDFPLPEAGTDRIEDTSKPTNTSQAKPLPPPAMKKSLPALPTDKALAQKSLLPLPPLSRPSSLNLSSGDTKDDLGSSAQARPNLPINRNQPQPSRPEPTVYAEIRSPWHNSIPPPPPQLKKKAGVEDLRMVQERGD